MPPFLSNACRQKRHLSLSEDTSIPMCLCPVHSLFLYSSSEEVGSHRSMMSQLTLCVCLGSLCAKWFEWLPSGVSVTSEARPIIVFYLRFRDICIYIYICLSVRKCIVQDCAHLTQVLSRRPLCIWNTGCCSAHHFEESPFR